MRPRGKIIVVALDIPVFQTPEYDNFIAQPFDKQLADFCKHIEDVCVLLSFKEKDADQWIIAWREYGLADANHRYVSVAQRKELKAAMQRLTAKYDKLKIISGTVASVRHFDEIDEDKKSKKIAKLDAAYLENTFQDAWKSDEQFAEHREKAFQTTIALLTSQASATAATTNDPSAKQASNPAPSASATSNVVIVRNTSYVFAKGRCIARHDKTTPYNETNGLEIYDAVFRPGKGRSHSSLINSDIAIEICREHDSGYLQYDLARQPLLYPIPKMQFVLSDSIPFETKRMVSPYVVYIDSTYELGLITDVPTADSEVKMFTYNVLSTHPILEPAPIITPEKFTMDYLMELFDADTIDVPEEYLKKHNGRFILSNNSCECLIVYAAAKLLQNDFYKRTYIVHSVIKAIINELKDERNAKIDPAIDFLCSVLFHATSTVKQKLKAGALIHTPQPIDQLLLLFSIQYRNNDLFEALVDKGVNLQVELANGITSFIKAAEYGNLPLVEKLLKMQGVDINATDQNGDTALHIAANNGDTDLVKFLISRGANVAATNKQRHDAYDLAIKYGREDTAAYLLPKTAEIDFLQYQKLEYACEQLT